MLDSVSFALGLGSWLGGLVAEFIIWFLRWAIDKVRERFYPAPKPEHPLVAPMNGLTTAVNALTRAIESDSLHRPVCTPAPAHRGDSGDQAPVPRASFSSLCRALDNITQAHPG